MKREEIVKVLKNFDDVHDPHVNNIILGDFNFVDFDIDKGKGMSAKDHTIKPFWDSFLSKNAIVDPFRSQCPNRRIYSFIGARQK